jgi:hypothetical protein
MPLLFSKACVLKKHLQSQNYSIAAVLCRKIHQYFLFAVLNLFKVISSALPLSSHICIIKALNSSDTQLIGYLVSKGDVYIGHICSKDDTCIGHCLESALGFLLNTWKVPFQAPHVNFSWETITLQCF